MLSPRIDSDWACFSYFALQAPFHERPNPNQPNPIDRHTNVTSQRSNTKRMSCKEWICFCLAGFLFVTAVLLLWNPIWLRVELLSVFSFDVSQDEINSDCHKIGFTTTRSLASNLHSTALGRVVQLLMFFFFLFLSPVKYDEVEYVNEVTGSNWFERLLSTRIIGSFSCMSLCRSIKLFTQTTVPCHVPCLCFE